MRIGQGGERVALLFCMYFLNHFNHPLEINLIFNLLTQIRAGSDPFSRNIGKLVCVLFLPFNLY